MKHNLKKHRRRSVRLKEYDYASPGWYFVTICTHERESLFGEVVECQMRPSRIGAIAQECWNEIPRHCHWASLDASIVMPNHLHGIVVLGRDSPWRVPMAARKAAFGKPVPGSLATIVGLFKQAVTSKARAHVGTPHPDVGVRHGVPLQVWQKNYYEHIIRNEGELHRIREYICSNPLRWPYDNENPARRGDAVDGIEDILEAGEDSDG